MQERKHFDDTEDIFALRPLFFLKSESKFIFDYLSLKFKWNPQSFNLSHII